MGNVERGKAMGFKEFKMVKRVSLGVMAVLLCIAAVSQAQDSGLHGNVSLAYQSSYNRLTANFVKLFAPL